MRKKIKNAYEKGKQKVKGSGVFKGATWKKAVKEEKMSWSETVVQTFMDTTLAVAGGAAGTFMGPWSMIPALPLNIFANKTGQRWLRSVTIGMTAAGFNNVISSQRTTGDTGFNFKAEVEEGTERVKQYFSQMKQKFGLSKLFPGNGGNSSTDTQTSTQADTQSQNVNGVGINALDNWEHQIVSSGIEHEGNVASSSNIPPATPAEKAEFVETFSVNGLDDLETPHVI